MSLSTAGEVTVPRSEAERLAQAAGELVLVPAADPAACPVLGP